jgi:hypothetical protein
MGESWAGPESRLELLEGKSWTGLLDGRGVDRAAELDNRAARWEREGGGLDGAAGWERAGQGCWHSMELLDGKTLDRAGGGRESAG